MGECQLYCLQEFAAMISTVRLEKDVVKDVRCFDKEAKLNQILRCLFDTSRGRDTTVRFCKQRKHGI